MIFYGAQLPLHTRLRELGMRMERESPSGIVFVILRGKYIKEIREM
jgi:hypothetical protein